MSPHPCSTILIWTCACLTISGKSSGRSCRAVSRTFFLSSPRIFIQVCQVSTLRRNYMQTSFETLPLVNMFSWFVLVQRSCHLFRRYWKFVVVPVIQISLPKIITPDIARKTRSWFVCGSILTLSIWAFWLAVSSIVLTGTIDNFFLKVQQTAVVITSGSDMTVSVKMA